LQSEFNRFKLMKYRLASWKNKFYRNLFQGFLILRVVLMHAMIEVVNLGCKIDKTTELFSEVSFSISAGETMLITGESGSGKTALLKIIAGLLQPDIGEVSIAGVRQSVSLSDVKKNIGMVFQNNALFDNMTAGENIAFPLQHLSGKSRDESRNIAMDLIEKLDVGDIWDKKINMLSGGMQKRVAIARAVAPEPAVILFDEPLQGIDPVNSRKIITLLRNIKNSFSPAIIIVSNEFKLMLSEADKIGVLERESFILYKGREEFLSFCDDIRKNILNLPGRIQN